jgi:uncharacterized glyoxalase superfamily protein PhnB
MSTRWALPSIEATTKAALPASQEGIADCLSPIAPSGSPMATQALSLFWLNLASKAEVDELFAQWNAAQAKIVSEPEDKPWKLREFMAADLDGNLIRVFYDFRWDL